MLIYKCSEETGFCLWRRRVLAAACLLVCQNQSLWCFCPLMIILSFSCSVPVVLSSTRPTPFPPVPPLLLLLYRSREFLIASCRLYQSDPRLRKPTAPQACSVLACSSTNKLWPTCSFSSRLPLFRQVGILIALHRPLVSPLTFMKCEGCTKTCNRHRVPKNSWKMCKWWGI